MDRSEEKGTKTGRRRRDTDRRFASDYYYNSNQPVWNERNEEMHRHNYGLPASGRTGHRRHNFSEWGNSNFTTNNSDRGYGRVNERRRQFDNEHIDYPSGREYDYNRFGMGDQGGTWNQRGDESYDWGEHNQNTSHYSSDLSAGRQDLDRAKHRGKGPKGFQRSDERVREDINCRLTDDAYVDASDIEVAVSNGEVTLTGTVPDRSSKRRAEDISELVSGVSNVENRLRVK